MEIIITSFLKVCVVIYLNYLKKASGWHRHIRLLQLVAQPLIEGIAVSTTTVCPRIYQIGHRKLTISFMHKNVCWKYITKLQYLRLKRDSQQVYRTVSGHMYDGTVEAAI